MRILLVEDDDNVMESFTGDLNRLKREQPNIEIIVDRAKSLDEAMQLLAKSHDGAIIDLKLDGDGADNYSGNKLIEIIQTKNRIPFCVYTGTPERFDVEKADYVQIFIRDVNSYREALLELITIYQTGITKIAGGRGEIEKAINHIFSEHLLPLLPLWKQRLETNQNVEKLILRFTLARLLDHLETDAGIFIPEEIYISPIMRAGKIWTGCVVKQKEDMRMFVVLTPACDLVLRGNGQPKTSNILLGEIEPLSIALELCTATRRNKRKSFFENLANNNFTLYYHFLPRTTLFEGGIINFRKIHTVPTEDFNEVFDAPSHQISSAFVKDIIARFANYYARQGQPSFDPSEWVNEVVAG